MKQKKMHKSWEMPKWGAITAVSLMVVTLGMSTGTGLVRAAAVEEPAQTEETVVSDKMVTGEKDTIGMPKVEPARPANAKGEPIVTPQAPAELEKPKAPEEPEKPEPAKTADVTLHFTTIGFTELAPSTTLKDFPVGEIVLRDLATGHLPELPGRTPLGLDENKAIIHEGANDIYIFFSGDEPEKPEETPEPVKTADVTMHFVTMPGFHVLAPPIVLKDVQVGVHLLGDLVKGHLPDLPNNSPMGLEDENIMIYDGKNDVNVYYSGKAPEKPEEPVKKAHVILHFITWNFKELAPPVELEEDFPVGKIALADLVKGHLPDLPNHHPDGLESMAAILYEGKNDVQIFFSGPDPEEPETPEVPEQPGENPTEPGQPENPSTPEVPNTPSQPNLPEVPQLPIQPGTPEKPETPVKPETPATDAPENEASTTKDPVKQNGHHRGSGPFDYQVKQSATDTNGGANEALPQTGEDYSNGIFIGSAIIFGGLIYLMIVRLKKQK